MKDIFQNSGRCIVLHKLYEGQNQGLRSPEMSFIFFNLNPFQQNPCFGTSCKWAGCLSKKSPRSSSGGGFFNNTGMADILRTEPADMASEDMGNTGAALQVPRQASLRENHPEAVRQKMGNEPGNVHADTSNDLLSFYF